MTPHGNEAAKTYVSIVDADLPFADLYEKNTDKQAIAAGRLVHGKVVAITRDAVIIDVGFKSEGPVPIDEFRNMDGEVEVVVGDEVDVVLEALEKEEGLIALSKEKANALKTWDHVSQIYTDAGVIEGVITSKVKGGMWVNLGGIRAFLPGSQIDLKPVKNLDRLLGKKFKFKILKLNKAKGNIVLSRRALLESEREERRKFLLENLREGQIVEGTVKNITEYGAFVDLGGIDGLLHITDITWGRVSHTSEVFQVGDEIQVVILKYDAEQGKVSLGYKQLKPDPWGAVKDKFKAGEIAKGKVTNITDYGVFVELDQGIEGLVHVSEMSWSKKLKHPSKIVKSGDQIEAMILDVDAENRRISLGLKQVEENPWDRLIEKYPVGGRIKGVVRNVTDFGIFVGIADEEIDGLVHISDLSWDKVGHPSDLYKKGDSVEAVVLQVDKETERFSLGVKQLSSNPWEVVKGKFPVNKVVSGTVDEMSEKSVVVRLDADTIGVLPISEVKRDGQELKEMFKVGDAIDVLVHHYDQSDRRIIVSQKHLEEVQQRAEMDRLRSSQGEAKVKFEDLLKDDLKKG